MDGYLVAALILVAFTLGSFAGYGVKAANAYKRGYDSGYKFAESITRARLRRGK